MLNYYTKLTNKSDKLLSKLLEWRLKRGKEDATRLNERKGIASKPRPNGTLIWLHAASVGEAQSTLILISSITKEMPNAQFMVTSGTVTSAQVMAKRLPGNAFHQFYPLDHPQWTTAFLDHWRPDLILWMESEIWPNMLSQIKQRQIPTLLINARLSQASFNIWNIFSGSAKKLLANFDLILAQTKDDQDRFVKLGANNVIMTDNIKYSAAPLPVHDADLSTLKNSIGARPLWVYASTHEGEELLACRIHSSLVQKVPDLLTIIVPRHPERRGNIAKTCELMNLETVFRGDTKNLPTDDTAIYVADTLGELGTFYALSDIAMIGRSFSDDGGGGHNPIEAAQLGCSVMTGPNIQFQEQLFNEMFIANAAYQMDDKSDLLRSLRGLISDDETRQDAILRAQKFAATKTNVINTVMDNLKPFLNILKKKGESNAA